MFNWIVRRLEDCGFYGDVVEEDDVEFTPISYMLGSYVPKEEFAQMRDGVVAIEFVDYGIVELYRVGIKEFTVNGEVQYLHGLWPLNGDVNRHPRAIFNSDTYGQSWRAFHISFPINTKLIGVANYS